MSPSATPRRFDDASVYAADDPVLGLDNVALDLPLAGVGSRCLAFTIDLILVSIAAVLWAALAMGVLPLAGLPFAWAVTVALLGVFLIQWSYWTATELTMDGRTPGKSLVGLRTVSQLGGRPSPWAIVLRNLLRSIDVLVGVLVMLLDRRSRRIGDLLAGTLVVHDRPATPTPAIGRMPASFGGAEMALLETFLRRAPRMREDVSESQAMRWIEILRRREPTLVTEARAPLDGPLGNPLGWLHAILRVDVDRNPPTEAGG